MQRLTVALCSGLLLAFSTAAFAKTIKVKPGPGTPLADGVAQLEDGDKLVISKGEYTERLVLADRTDIKILGKRGAVVIGNGGGAVLSFTDCDSLAIKGLTTAATLTDGILVLRCADVTIQKTIIGGARISGVHVESSTGISLVQLTIVGDATQTSAREGVRLRSSSDVTISRCFFGRGLRSGISGESTEAGPITDISIVRSRFEDIEGVGASIGGERFLVSKCRFARCGGDGFIADTENESSMVIEKSTFEGMVGRCMTVNAPNVTVRKNTFRDGVGFGLVVSSNGTNVQVEKNTFKRVEGGAMTILAVGAIVRSNKMSGATSEADFVVLLRGSGGVFEKNKITKNDCPGIELNGAGYEFRKNVAVGNVGGDLVSRVAASSNTFENNKFGTESFPSKR